MKRLKIKKTLISLALTAFAFAFIYYHVWGRHTYLVTAYCNCPVCINVEAFRDGRFASGKPVYWGGVAADRKIPFGATVELAPVLPHNSLAVSDVLKGRKKFTVEDRGGKIKGRHIDIFIPDSLGGHKAAKRWGARRMRLKINNVLAE